MGIVGRSACGIDLGEKACHSRGRRRDTHRCRGNNYPHSMKTSRKLLAAFFAACFITAVAFGGDPTGVWKWSTPGRDGQTFESTLKLDYKDGKLSGTLTGRMGETPISAATLKDDAIAFSVEREFNGNKFTIKYAGKLEGDSIKGESEFPRPDGEVMKREWNAQRVK